MSRAHVDEQVAVPVVCSGHVAAPGGSQVSPGSTVRLPQRFTATQDVSVSALQPVQVRFPVLPPSQGTGSAISQASPWSRTPLPQRFTATQDVSVSSVQLLMQVRFPVLPPPHASVRAVSQASPESTVPLPQLGMQGSVFTVQFDLHVGVPEVSAGHWPTPSIPSHCSPGGSRRPSPQRGLGTHCVVLSTQLALHDVVPVVPGGQGSGGVARGSQASPLSFVPLPQLDTQDVGSRRVQLTHVWFPDVPGVAHATGTRVSQSSSESTRPLPQLSVHVPALHVPRAPPTVHGSVVKLMEQPPAASLQASTAQALSRSQVGASPRTQPVPVLLGSHVSGPSQTKPLVQTVLSGRLLHVA